MCTGNGVHLLGKNAAWRRTLGCPYECFFGLDEILLRLRFGNVPLRSPEGRNDPGVTRDGLRKRGAGLVVIKRIATKAADSRFDPQLLLKLCHGRDHAWVIRWQHAELPHSHDARVTRFVFFECFAVLSFDSLVEAAKFFVIQMEAQCLLHFIRSQLVTLGVCMVPKDVTDLCRSVQTGDGRCRCVGKNATVLFPRVVTREGETGGFFAEATEEFRSLFYKLLEHLLQELEVIYALEVLPEGVDHKSGLVFLDWQLCLAIFKPRVPRRSE